MQVDAFNMNKVLYSLEPQVCPSHLHRGQSALKPLLGFGCCCLQLPGAAGVREAELEQPQQCRSAQSVPQLPPKPQNVPEGGGRTGSAEQPHGGVHTSGLDKHLALNS